MTTHTLVPLAESHQLIVEALLEHVDETWSTMVMRTQPFPDDLFQHVHPHHQVLLSCKPHRPGCHQWRPLQQNINAEIQELKPDVIVERLEHHQSGQLTKDPGCPVCMEEAGSKVSHRRKKGDRSPGVMHCDLAAFEASADGHKYCLVTAVTIEINKKSKLLPIFIPMPKKDAVCAVAARKEALTMCDNRNLHQIPGSRIVRIQADGGGAFTNQKVRDLCWEKNITLSYSAAHQPSSNGIAERMVSSRVQFVEC